MILIVKATHIEKTPSILKRIEGICSKLEQYAGKHDPDALVVRIEVGRITKHHRKGTVYRAEINVSYSGRLLRSKAAAGAAVTALDEAKDEIERRFLKEKRAAVSIKHREGVRLKRRQTSLQTRR